VSLSLTELWKVFLISNSQFETLDSRRFFFIANPLPLLYALSVLGDFDKIFLISNYQPQRKGGRNYDFNLNFCKKILAAFEIDYQEVRLEDVSAFQSNCDRSNFFEAQVLGAYTRTASDLGLARLPHSNLILLEADWFLIFKKWYTCSSLWEIKILYLWKKLAARLKPNGFLILHPLNPVSNFRNFEVASFPLEKFVDVCKRVSSLGLLKSELSVDFDFSVPIVVLSPREDISVRDLADACNRLILEKFCDKSFEVLVKPHPNFELGETLLNEIENEIGLETLNSRLALNSEDLGVIPLELFFGISEFPYYLGPFSSATALLNINQYEYLSSMNLEIDDLEKFNYAEFERLYHRKL